MTISLKKYWYKITNKEKYKDYKITQNIKKDLKNFKQNFENHINNIQKKIREKKELSFLHSGHAGDIVNILPVIKELSKTHICTLYVQTNKPLNVKYHKHPAGEVFINEKIFNMLLPLLQSQKCFNKIEKYNNQAIDINFDIIRDLPINIHFDNVKYYFHVTGIQPDLNEPYLHVEPHKTIKEKIVIHRTFRYRNFFINYKFMNKYKNLLFVGTKDEYEDLKKDVQNLEFHDCKDFLEMAMIIKSSKFFIGNSSLAFPIAEAVKVPRLLEACPYFPAAQTHGKKAFDFYYQIHFEKWFEYLYRS